MPKQESGDENAGVKPEDQAKPPAAAASGPGGSPAKPEAANAGPHSAIELLKADHRKVEALFGQYEKATSGKEQIVRQICTELRVHTILEEEIFYPACRRAANDEEPLDEAQVEHDSAKVLITDLLRGSARDRFRDAKVSVLAEQIRHHVKEEEAPGQGIFAKAQAAGVDTPELAKRLADRKQNLLSNPDALPPAQPVSFQLLQPRAAQDRENFMASYRSDDRDRDDRGRFMSEDQRGGRDRDDDRGYRSRGRDDDEGRGWHGDPEGHSQASQRGWAERRGETRSFRDRDDDDRGRMRGGGPDRDERGRFASDDRGYDRDRDDRGRYADDDRGRGQGGWFGDSRGHAEAARRGWEERERGGDRGRDDDYRGRGRDDDDGGRGRGWFGDSEGHAAAARQGRDDRDRGGSRSRDDDDRGRGRGEGGWFGDSRGHSEAARRGWQDRR